MGTCCAQKREPYYNYPNVNAPEDQPTTTFAEEDIIFGAKP
jgi:GTPase SAR1 family protein